MFGAVSRMLSYSTRYCIKTVHSRTCKTIAHGVKHASEQITYLKSVINHNQSLDWTSIKNKLLSMPGTINEKNVDAVMLKVLVNEKKIDIAKSLAQHLLSSGKGLNLGTTNAILNLYTELSKINQLSENEKQFIQDKYKEIYSTYKVPDYTTSERLLHALCAVNDWRSAIKVLEDIKISSTPTHSAYSTLIATLFKSNKKEHALKFINESISMQRPLLDIAYEEWINYVLRKYKAKKSIEKHLEEICFHLSMKFVVIPEKAAGKLLESYKELGWSAERTKIRKIDGQCSTCKINLDCLKLTQEEFQLLQNTIKDKLLVGNDLFLKTFPEELQRFQRFVEKTAPYDVVIDALNVCYSAGKYTTNRVSILANVVEHFEKTNKKILLLGRKHMLNWPKMKYVLSRTCNFFTENLSQDDPFFITAALLSGYHTDFVSRDLLRGHRFILHDEHLKHLFQRWQWQHQWTIYINRHGQPKLQPPLAVTPCAQKNNSTWHVPFEREDALQMSMGQIKDGTPDWTTWLCLQPPER